VFISVSRLEPGLRLGLRIDSVHRVWLASGYAHAFVLEFLLSLTGTRIVQRKEVGISATTDEIRVSIAKRRKQTGCVHARIRRHGPAHAL